MCFCYLTYTLPIMIENSNPQNRVSYCKMGKYTYSVMQFHAPQNATGCNKIFPNKHSLNSARLGKNSVKWGVFIPSALIKHKARMCVNGKQQELGRDYWETYAPVASWASIRLMLILSSILNLRTCQIDYTQAFPQAKLEDPVFIHIPQGWHIKDGNLQQHPDPRFNDTQHFLRLKRNLYGIKQAAHNWFQYL